MRIFLVLLALGALMLGGSAAEGCIVTTSDAVMAGPIYVAGNARSLFCDPTCLMDLWVYEESNGMDGLQRRDEMHDDTCNGRVEGDTVLF